MLSSNLFAATEFVSLLKSSGGDYSSVQTWESQMDNAGDITNANCKVFSHSGIFGSVWDNSVVTGETSGATGVTIHATSRQILIDTISGTFQSGERVKAGQSDFVILTNVGDSAIIVGMIDGTLAGKTTIDGFTTSSTNYVKLTSAPWNRHQGTASTGSRMTFTTVSGFERTVIASNDYTLVEWLIFEPSIGHDHYTLRINANNVQFNNNILHPTSCTSTMQCHGIFNGGTFTGHSVSNNIIYEYNSNSLSGGIVTYSTGTQNAYNNTVYDCDYNFHMSASGTPLIAKNNIAQGGDTADYQGTYDGSSTHNLSSDATAPGTINYRTKTVSFVSTSTDNYHLSSSDVEAYNLGTDTTTTANIDIDNFDRDTSGVTWDLGADERWTNTTINGATLNGATIN